MPKQPCSAMLKKTRHAAFGTLLAVVFALPAIGSSADTPEPASEPTINLHSPAFGAHGDIPERFSCQGAGRSPPLAWSNVPQRAKSLALLVRDPDAPSGDWIHWIVYNLPADLQSIAENAGDRGVPADAGVGKNSWGDAAYGGVCPPSGQHHYHFQIFALDTRLAEKPYEKKALLQAMRGHLLARGELVATYRKR